MIPTLPALIIVGVGAMTAIILSFVDFHRPYGVSEVRHSVVRERYWLAAAGYASIGLSGYLALVGAITWVIAYLFEWTTLDERGRPFAVAAMVSVFILSWFSRAPIGADMSSGVRKVLQTVVARYPQSLLTAAAIIARAPFTPHAQAEVDLANEMKRYALPGDLIKAALTEDNRVLSASVRRVLLEILSLRACFAEVRKNPKFANFFAARTRTCAQIEQEHNHLMRRVARVLTLSQDFEMKDQAEEFTLELSDFISDECDVLRSRYHRLLAEMILSAVHDDAGRKKMATTFGYDVGVARTLPSWPIGFMFAIYLSLPFLLFSISPVAKISIAAAGLLSFAQTWAVAIAVFLAVYPKETNFGRPTIFSLPWRSYLVYGAISYGVGVAILLFAYTICNSIPLFKLPDNFISRTNPLAASLLFSTIFVYFTIGLSILLDRRIQTGALDYQRGRVSDGLRFAGPMILLMVAMFAAIQVIAAWSGNTPPFTVIENIQASAIYLSIIFLIGYFVPSTAHAHLEATKIILSSGINTKPTAWSSNPSESRPASAAYTVGSVGS